MTENKTLNEEAPLQRSESVLPDPQLTLGNKWHGSIIERFLENAKNSPASLCLAGETEQWNYGEVDTYTNTLARNLSHKGVSKDSIVLIIGKRTPALSLAMIAVLRAGAAFLIIDPKYPVMRVQQYSNYAKPVGIINLVPDTALKQALLTQVDKDHDKFWIDLYDPISKTDGIQSHALGEKPYQVSVGPDNLMYLAFTSGTTGVPRAITGSHSPVSHFLLVQTTRFKISPQDRVSVLSGLAHDPLLRDVLMPLWAGASSWFPSNEAFEYPGRLLKWMKQSGITITHLTPSLGQFMLQVPEAQSFITCNRLRHVFFGGEALSVKLVDRIKRFAPSAQVINCYGATETPQVVGWHIYGDGDKNQTNGIVPIGKGIDDSQLLILNESKSLCNVGELGEINVRTSYLPIKVEHIIGEKTASFIVNPYTSKQDDRIYATGDYGKYLSDGTVVFHGRKDRQVKIRGFRVDLSEVENVVRRSEQVDAFELIVDQTQGLVKLQLFVTFREASHDEAETLRQELLQQLPYFMIPEQIYVLPALPMTPNGKVDRKKLLEIADQEKLGNVAETLDQNSIESRLLKLMRKSLNSRAIHSESELIKCGIDSLKSVELCCLIEQEFGIELSTSQLMSCINISGIASLIACHETDSGSVEERNSGPQEQSKYPTKGSISKSLHNRISLGEGDKPSYMLTKKSRLIPGNEPFVKGICNRLLQLLARVSPDVWRVKLHKWRGVYIGENVSIGYDTILETSYPYLIHIGNNVNIGMRVTVIGHFRGMTNPGSGAPTVKIGDYSFIGPGVIILPNVEIGEGAVVAAGSVVSASVQPMTMVQGNPAKVVALCGIPLSGRATYSEFIDKLKPV